MSSRHLTASFPDGRGHRLLAGIYAGVIGNMVAMLCAALMNTVWQGGWCIGMMFLPRLLLAMI